MAPLHRDGRVLPERPATYLGWLVRPAFSALVSRGHSIRHAGSRACAGGDAIFAAALANRLLFHCDAVANRRDPHGELYVSELSGPYSRILPARRSLSHSVCAPALATPRSHTGP